MPETTQPKSPEVLIEENTANGTVRLERMEQLNLILGRILALNHAIRLGRRNLQLGIVDFQLRVNDIRSPSSDYFRPRLVDQLNMVLTECADKCSRLILEQQECARLTLIEEARRLCVELAALGESPTLLYSLTCRVMPGHKSWRYHQPILGPFPKPVDYYVGPINDRVKANRYSRPH